MKGDEFRRGRVVVEGLVFDWCENTAGQLDVWQWQCGRKTSTSTGNPDQTAKTLARELIAEFDQRQP